MLSKGSVGGEEVSYSEVAPKLETVVSTGRSDCTFRYCKDGKNLNSWSCEDSPCFRCDFGTHVQSAEC